VGDTTLELQWRAAAAVVRRAPEQAGRMRLARKLHARLRAPSSPLRSQVDGLSVELDLADRIQAEFFLFGGWEPGIRNTLVAHLPDGGVFVDVGANVGFATMSVARRTIGRGVSIHAFEPHPQNVARLRSTLRLNPRIEPMVQVNEAALGAQEGELRLALGGESFHHHLSDRGDLPVRVERLDSYVERNGIARIDCLKLDVEGGEVQVLRGAQRLLEERRIGLVVCEVLDPLLQRSGTSASELTGLLLSAGYAPVVLENFSQRLAGVVRANAERPVMDGDIAFFPIT
jgi:FkbM family methyltransferase